jgi:hypothetical protein
MFHVTCLAHTSYIPTFASDQVRYPFNLHLLYLIYQFILTIIYLFFIAIINVTAYVTRPFPNT